MQNKKKNYFNGEKENHRASCQNDRKCMQCYVQYDLKDFVRYYIVLWHHLSVSQLVDECLDLGV